MSQNLSSAAVVNGALRVNIAFRIVFVSLHGVCLKCKQTVQTLMRYCLQKHVIWFYSVLLLSPAPSLKREDGNRLSKLLRVIVPI